MSSEDDTPEVPAEPKKAKRPRASQSERFIEASLAIPEDPDFEDTAFLHAIFCQVGLPRSSIEGTQFIRRSGDAWLSVQAGLLDEGKGPVQQPVPYGSTPRMALAYLTTYAVKNRSKEIPIGDSASEFLRLMGIHDRQQRRYTMLRKQMHALAACRLQIGYRGRNFSGQPISQFDAWVSNKDQGQRSFWPGLLVLSEDYYKSLLTSAVPLNFQAMHVLRGSSLALDVYVWLAHRLHRVNGQSYDLSWARIREQFGQDYEGKNPAADFKKKFKAALTKVKMVYPKARVELIHGGLRLFYSPPPIAPTVKAVTRSKADSGVLP